MKSIRVGRGSGNDIVIQHDGTVSRTHCQFIMDDNGNYRVIDLNSANGTFVNGVRRSGETKLQANDTVRIGNTMLPWQNYFQGRPGGTVVDGGATRVDLNPPYIPPAPPVEEPKKGCGFGIAALVCGILGLSLLAIVFGAVSMSRKESNKGLGIAGLILGIIWACVSAILLLATL
ncbi:MAG: FHA domain-containing protein [Bacteroidales bacterium]|nr:FHA domain-containing protein [Bacteroidales bacterium]